MDRSSEFRSGKLQRVEAPGWMAKKSLHHPVGGGPASDDLPQVIEAKGGRVRSPRYVERRVALTRSRILFPGECQPVGLRLDGGCGGWGVCGPAAEKSEHHSDRNRSS